MADKKNRKEQHYVAEDQIEDLQGKELSAEEQRRLDEAREKELERLEREDVVISPARMVWNNFKARKITMIGAGMFLFIILFSLLLPVFLPEIETDMANRRVGPSLFFWREGHYLFGTDNHGRDVFLRVADGGFVSLYVGAVATFISVIIGTIIGSVSGYFHGIIDNILQRFTEIVRAFPFLPLVITLSAAIGADLDEDERIFLIMVILGVIGWTGLARLLRGQILSLREQEFILAARAMGVKNFQIIAKHIIPNVISLIIVSATLQFAANILVESGLSFLGFGVQEPGNSWGLLLRQGTRDSSVIQNQPWLWFFPGLFILATVLSINFIGDGLRDAVDPRNVRR